jgi:hypothetical protein
MTAGTATAGSAHPAMRSRSTDNPAAASPIIISGGSGEDWMRRLRRMALGDAINLLLHRAGVGVDVEGDHHLASARSRHGRTCSGHPRLALIRR